MDLININIKSIFFFFFQAEDGIRHIGVTGVQTCALPISTPQRAYDEGLALARRWRGVGANRYAVIPRFSLSCGDPLLQSCASLLTDVEGSWFTSHVNENVREIAAVAELFDGRRNLDTYDRHGLIGRRSVLAHKDRKSTRLNSS